MPSTSGPSAEPSPPFVPGYRVLGVLGRGAGGPVWRALRERDDTEVAVKVVRSGPAASVELAALSRVRQPHLVPLLHSVALPDGRHALVTPVLDGGTLGSVVRARGRLLPGEVVTVLGPVAQAVADLHEHGVQHGDLAPGNVLLDGSGRPYLADLGTVRITGDPRAEVFGSPGFVDPAVLAGGPPGPASDVYGLGALAWYSLCGSPPDPLRRRPLASVAPTSCASLGEVVDAALAPDVGDRPSAAELAQGLLDAVPARAVWRAGGAPDDGGLTHRVVRRGAGVDAAGSGAARHRRPPRRRRPPQRTMLVGAGSIAAMTLTVGVAAGLVGAGTGGGAAEAVATQPSAGWTPSRPSVTRSTAPSGAGGWDALAVVRALAGARSAAFARPGCGRGVATPAAGSLAGSPAGRQDAVALATLSSRCLAYRGLRIVPRTVTVVRASAASATVEVLADRSGYDVVDTRTGRSVRRESSGVDASRLDLRRTSTGWAVARIEAARLVSPSPSGPPTERPAARR